MKISNIHVENFRYYLCEEEKAPATVEKYIRDVLGFKAWVKDSPVSKQLVLAYKEHLSCSYCGTSVNSMLSSVNSFFDFMGWHELKVKTLRIPKRIFASTEKELTKAEYERLLKAAKSKKNKRLYLLMQTICSSGIRVSELRFITLEAAMQKQALIKCKGKMRVVILPGELCRLLISYAKLNGITGGPIFVTRSGKPIDRSTIWKMMKALCESAGVSRNKVFPHNLRHLFARTYYTVQKDIVRLADILGHSSINTTRIYTMESGEVHRRQIQMLGLIRI